MKKSYKRGNLIVELDRSQVFPDNPGDGCPALVYYLKRGRLGDSGSYNCIVNEGAFMDGRPISESEMDWLVGLEDKIENFLHGD